MTFLTFLLVVLTAFSLLLGWYFRRAEAGVLEAMPVWDRLIANVNRMVADPDVPDEIAKSLTIYADLAGCGCFVASLVRDALLRDMSKKYQRERQEKGVLNELRYLSEAQKRLLEIILTDLLLFDSLRMPFLGYVFRWMLSNSLDAVTDAKNRARIEGIHSVMYAAHFVAQRRLKKHQVPHQDLIANAA